MPVRQLPLMIPSDPVYAAGFLPAASNEAARAWLDQTEAWPDRRLALWGGADRGKTHLLRIWAERIGAEVMDGRTLTGLSGISARAGVALDDADAADEHALLHLLNTARDRDRPVLLAARVAPARWPVTLPDLASRLRAFVAVEVGAPGDDLLRGLLLRWLTEHRLVADEALHNRLLTHLPRSPDVLRAAVARLDRDALVSRRRKITPAMLSAALADASFDDQESLADTLFDDKAPDDPESHNTDSDNPESDNPESDHTKSDDTKSNDVPANPPEDSIATVRPA